MENKTKIYLRQINFLRGTFTESKLDIFEGNPELDYEYWKKYQSVDSIRYFELKQVKLKGYKN
jgi:hypothetical protein